MSYGSDRWLLTSKRRKGYRFIRLIRTVLNKRTARRKWADGFNIKGKHI